MGTTHTLAPINLSVGRAAKDLIRNGKVDDHILNRIEMAVPMTPEFPAPPTAWWTAAE